MNVNVKSPDGGFYLQGDQFTVIPDGKGHNVVTVGGNVVVDGAPYIILKSATPGSLKEFKVTITDDGTANIEEVLDDAE